MRFTSGCGVWVIAVAAAAWAQDQPDKKQDEKTPQEKEKTVVITASPLNPKDVFDTAFSADVVTSRDLSERLSRTLPEGLRETVGAGIQKTGNGQTSPFIRGFTGFRNVFLIDGIRLNNSVFREGPNQYWSTVDSYLIDRLEIVRGPSSVLYGSDAMGGTVVAYTREPWDWKAGDAVHSRSQFRFASAEESYILRQDVFGNYGGFGASVGATYRDYHDITAGDETGHLPYTGYNEVDGDIKLTYRFDPKMRLVLGHQSTRQNGAPRTHSTTASREFHGTSIGTDIRRDFDQERDLTYLQFYWTSEGGFVDELSASLSWHRHAETEDRRTSSKREIREFTLDQPGAWMRAGKKTSFGFLTGGFEYYRDIVDSKGRDVSSSGTVTEFRRGSVADDAAYDLFGIFLQDEVTLFEKLDVTAGIRFAYAHVRADEVDPIKGDAVVFDPLEDTYSAVVGNLRLLYRLDQHWNLIAGWGMGFRAPSLDDSTAIKLTLSGTLDLPNGHLKPEFTHTFDLGARTRYEFDDWGFEVGLFGYYTLLRDFLRRIPSGIDFNGDGKIDNIKDNFSNGEIYGVEFQARVTLFKQVAVWGDFAWTLGSSEVLIGSETKDRAIAKMNPTIGHIGVRWQKPEAKWYVEGIVTMAALQARLAPEENGEISNDFQRIPPTGTPGYAVLTLRAGYTPCKNATVTVAVENVGNTDYRIHGSGQNEPGTNFIAGVEVRF